MSNSATIGLLRVLLTANSAEFETAMKRSSDIAKTWSTDMKSIGTQATAVGTALTKTITLPILGLAAASVKAAMDFESSFANVAKTVDGVSDASGTLTTKGLALAMTFRQMAKEIPATTAELNTIAAMGGQMGVSIDNLGKFTKNVAALGVAVDGISAEEAAKGLAQISNIFGDKEQKNIDKMSSALVHLGNASNATEADILEFSKRLAGAGNAVGMSVPDIMALGTAMADVGINAEAGGTAMSTMITKMSMAVSKGGDALAAFAKVSRMSAEEFTAAWRRSPIEAVDAVVKGLAAAKASGQDLNLVVREIGATNIRTADTMKRLAGAGDGVATSLKTANEGWATGNKHLIEAEKKYATTANQLKVLWNQITDVGITLGNALLPAIKSATTAMSVLIPVIDGLAQMFAAMPGPLQAIFVGLGLAAAAAGPLIWAFGQLALSASAVTAAFTAKGIATRLLTGLMGTAATAATGTAASVGVLGTAIGLLTNPIALAIAGLGLFGFAIYKVVTAESDLEKSLRSNAGAFKQETDALKSSLDTYETLRNKKNLTRDETKRLDEATRALAKASGLSKEAFDREAQSSGELTAELRKQLEERKRLFAQAVDDSREAAVQALRDVQRVQAELDKVQSGKGTKVISSPAGDVRGRDSLVVPLDANDRIQEVARLEAALGKLKARADEATKAFNDLRGLPSTPEEMTIEEWSGRAKGIAAVTTQVNQLKQAQDEIAASNRQYKAELLGIEAALRLQIQNMDKTGKSTKDLAEQYKISEDSVSRFKKEIEGSVKSHKEAETAAAKHAKALEKLRAETAALGLITVDDLASELTDVNATIDRLTKAGIPLDQVLLALGPHLEELRKRAEASKIPLQGMATALNVAAEANKRLNDEVLRNARPALTALDELPGTLLQIDHAAAIAAIGAQNVTESFRFFGVSTREELQKTAADAEVHYRTIVNALGAQSPQAIAAWKKLQEAIVAAADEAPKVAFAWGRAFQDIAGHLQHLGSLFDNTFGRILQGSASVVQGIGNIITATTTWGKVMAAIDLGINLLGKAIGLFRDEAHEKTNDIRDEFLLQFGPGGTGPNSGFGVLAAQLAKIEGGTAAFKALLDAKTPEAFAKAMERVNTILANTPEALAAAAGYKTRDELQKTADQARKVYEYMRDSGKFTAEQIADAFEKSKDAQIAAMSDVQRAAYNTNKKIVDDLTKQLDTLDAEYNSIFESWAAEDAAPEFDEAGNRIFGVVEAAQRARLDAIALEREQIQKQLDDANEAMRLSLEDVAESVRDLVKVLRDELGGALDDLGGRQVRIRVGFDVDDLPTPGTSAPGPENAATGGMVTSSGVRYLASGGFSTLGSALAGFWKPKGTDTEPYMLTPGELILNEGQQANIGASLRQAMQFVNSLKQDLSTQLPGGFPEAGPLSVGPFVMNFPPGELARVLKDGGPVIVEAWTAEVKRGGGTETRVRGALRLDA